MTLGMLVKATMDTIETTASVLFIVTSAAIFAWLLTLSQAAETLAEFILGLTNGKWGVPAARQRAAALRRLLPRHDRRDHDPGPDPDAHRPSSWASTRSISA